jgi:hypothetical protein
MSIIGCDLHSRYQAVAMLEGESGEVVTRRLEHESVSTISQSGLVHSSPNLANARLRPHPPQSIGLLH